MELWTTLITFLTQAIELLTLDLGLSQAVAIIVFTLLIRLVISPISTVALISSFRNRKAMASLKPELEKLKSTYKDDQQQLVRKTMELYRKHNIKFFGKVTIANISSQAVFGIGMFQALQKAMFSGGFGWIANIAKPDILLALFVGLITYLSMLIMPGSAEQASVLMAVIPAIICVVVLVSAPSALGLYWGTSSIFGLVQNLLVKKYLAGSVGTAVGR